jgi:hypothetical protein
MEALREVLSASLLLHGSIHGVANPSLTPLVDTENTISYDAYTAIFFFLQ